VSITRRDFIRTTVTIGIGGALASTCATTPRMKDPSLYLDVEETKQQAIRFMNHNGFHSTPAAPLISGLQFNGSLNYDDHIADKTHDLWVLQRCARVEDALTKGKAGTLPMFTILSLSTARGGSKERGASNIWNYLVNIVGLDPKKLRITTTEFARPLFAFFARYGVEESQIRLRSVDEARQQGNGSGYFEPKGHPHGPSFPTYSIEFVMPDGQELEIAEIDLEQRVAGFGVERVAMARNERLISWNESLPAFEAAINEEVERRGKNIPAGYYTITRGA
jgi:hypothetical protein